MADSDAVVVSAAAAREEGSSAGPGRGLRAGGAAGGAVPVSRRGVGAPGPGGAGQEGAGQVRAGRVCVHVGSCRAAAPAAAGDFPPWERPRARGSREKRRAVAAHRPRPGGQARGQRFQEHSCLERGLPTTHTGFAARWAATLNLIRSERLGIIRGLDPVERPGFVSRLFNEL